MRHLPTLVPPPAFREAVFAAIAADQRRAESPAARIARAETDPRLPVVRALPVARLPHTSGRRFNVSAAAAMAAVLLLALFTARLVPGLGMGTLGNALGGLFGGDTSPTISHYTPDRRFSLAAGALATSGWLVYSASDRSGETMLFAQSRRTRRETPLLAAATRAPITLDALTARWAIWSEGRDAPDADWTVHA
nr:hypothetical protein [Ktedonobacterales bacterium]